MNLEEEVSKMENVLRVGKRFPLIAISGNALLVRDEEGGYAFLTSSDKDAAVEADPVSQEDAEAIMCAGVQIALDGGVVRRPLRERVVYN